MNLLRKILQIMGIDQAITYFLIGKIFSFFASPLTLFLIMTYFSTTLQGYYYTISSLLALSIFFELGLGVVITHFASHEYAELKWTDRNIITGTESSVHRLISLIRKSLKWYFMLLLIFLILCVPIGLLFLGNNTSNDKINYQFPWIITLVFFSLGTCTIPITSVLEGCGRIDHVQKIRVIQNLSRSFCLWVSIISGLKLFVVSIEFIATWVVFVIWFFFSYKEFLKQILKLKIHKDYEISWKQEILPMQWRLAISYLSTYFSNYLFVPLLFAFRSPNEAGQMGMSLKLSEMIYLFSMALINTKAPRYGALIKNKKKNELNKFATKSTIQAIIVGILLSILILVGLRFVESYSQKYAGRLLSLSVLGIIFLTTLISIFMSSIAAYLRAFKKEQLMIVSIILAVLVTMSNYFSAKYFDVNIMVILYFLILLFVGVPLYLFVFKYSSNTNTYFS